MLQPFKELQHLHILFAPVKIVTAADQKVLGVFLVKACFRQCPLQKCAMTVNIRHYKQLFPRIHPLFSPFADSIPQRRRERKRFAGTHPSRTKRHHSGWCL